MSAWPELQMRRVVRLKSGDFIAAEEIEDAGAYPVYGGNGLRGFTENWNTGGPIALIGRQGAQCGNVQVVPGKAWVSEHALRCSPEKPLNVSFLRYALQSLNLGQYSVSAAQPGLSTDNLKPLLVPFPSLEIQEQVAAFLDEKTAQIDGLIAKKQALLDRLAEKRLAIITQAVTNGLNPAAPMKESGIKWLGQIPAHWSVKRLKYISPWVTVGIVVTPAAYYADEGVLALRGLNIKTMRFDFSDTRNITPEGHELNIKSTLQTGDLVAVRTGAPGTTAVIPKELEGSNCIDLVIIRRPLNASEQYLGWFLNSDIAQTQYAMGAEGALQQHFNVETSKEVIVTLPPPSEQTDIAKYIDRAIAAHDVQVDKVQQSIEKLTEYRSALITAAVTGQIARLQ